MSIRDDALNAYRSERDTLMADAIEAVTPVLTGPDGTFVGWQGLEAVHVDFNARMVVASDGDIALAVHEREDGWEVRLVEGEGSDWTRRSEPLGSLVDLGEALNEVR